MLLLLIEEISSDSREDIREGIGEYGGAACQAVARVIHGS